MAVARQPDPLAGSPARRSNRWERRASQHRNGLPPFAVPGSRGRVLHRQELEPPVPTSDSPRPRPSFTCRPVGAAWHPSVSIRAFSRRISTRVRLRDTAPGVADRIDHSMNASCRAATRDRPRTQERLRLQDADHRR